MFGVQPHAERRRATVERRPYWHEVTLLILNEDSSYLGFLMFATLIFQMLQKISKVVSRGWMESGDSKEIFTVEFALNTPPLK